MAYVFRKHYTRRQANGRKVTKTRRKWYIRYFDPLKGRRQTVPGFSDRKASEQRAAELERQAQRRASGLVDPAEIHWKRPLAEHLEAYRAYLVDKGSTPEHARRTIHRARQILEACQITSITGITLAPVQAYLAHLRQHQQLITVPEQECFTKAEIAQLFGVGLAAIGKQVRHYELAATGRGKARRFPRETVVTLALRRSQGKSVMTVNHYLQSIRGFCRWLVLDRRLPCNPLLGIKAGNVHLECRRPRRVLSQEEATLLMERTRQDQKKVFGMPGPVRSLLYAVAMGTGFRARELAMLRKADFLLHETVGSVRCLAAYSKNRRTVEQPLPPWLIPLLQAHLAPFADSEKIWPGAWYRKACSLVRQDLRRLGIPYQTQDGYFDFHAFRGQYITNLCSVTTNVKILQTLARHSDVRLTLQRYAKARQEEVFAVAAALPRPALVLV